MLGGMHLRMLIIRTSFFEVYARSLKMRCRRALLSEVSVQHYSLRKPIAFLTGRDGVSADSLRSSSAKVMLQAESRGANLGMRHLPGELGNQPRRLAGCFGTA